MRGGVVVSSEGAAFRDPRLFDRNKFESLILHFIYVAGSARRGRRSAFGLRTTDPSERSPSACTRRAPVETRVAHSLCSLVMSLVFLSAYFGSSL